MINLLHGDCLELMKEIPDNSIDMVLTDPPYGTTACKWDTVIDFGLMWRELKRITKDNSCAFIAILSILMGSMLGYLAGEEQASFGKDFMTFYCVVFGAIATVFIIKMLTDYQHLYDVMVLKHYRLEEAENTIKHKEQQLS